MKMKVPSLHIKKPNFKALSPKGIKAEVQNKIRQSKERLVLSIGDEGAILLHIKERELIKRLFIASPNTQEFRDYVNANPHASFVILVDVLDQTYIQHNLPPVSQLNVGKLVRKKLQKDFDEQDIQAAIQLGRETKGRKDWRFLFVSLRYAPPFSDWLDEVAEFKNYFAGIYLLPLETQKLLADLQNLRPAVQKVTTKWQILVSHNRVGGFRQIVFNNNQVVFTRIAQPLGGLAPDIIAGNIEQQTLNTIEYIRRLGFEAEDGLEIYTLTSGDVKSSLNANTFPTQYFYAYTPYELANALNIPTAAQVNDRFGDVVISMHFILQKKHVRKLFNNYTQKLKTLAFWRLSARGVTALFALIMVINSLIGGYNIISMSGEIRATIEKVEKSRRDLDEAIRSQAEFAQNPRLIIDIAKTHATLSEDINQPLDLMKRLTEVRRDNVTIKFITMDIKDTPEKVNQIKCNLDTNFENNSGATLDIVLDSVDKFEDTFRRSFKEYQVNVSSSLDNASLNINFNNQSINDVPIRIEMLGPTT